MSAHLSWAGSRLRLPAKCPTLVPLTTSYTSCMASACFPLAQQEFKDGAPAPGRSTVYTSGPASPGPAPKPRPSEAALKLALPFVPKSQNPSSNLFCDFLAHQAFYGGDVCTNSFVYRNWFRGSWTDSETISPGGWARGMWCKRFHCPSPSASH